MSDADSPRLACDDEFSEILELCDRCFRKERGGMAARVPFAYDPDCPEHHAVIRQDGRVVAHAAAVPQTLAVGGSEVACPGIGGIATDPRYRGNGHMSALLEFWLDELDAPLVELGGDRQRYGHFGWENGGREFRYRISHRSLPDSTPDVPCGLTTARMPCSTCSGRYTPRSRIA
jgi:predicted acetyltransferase